MHQICCSEMVCLRLEVLNKFVGSSIDVVTLESCVIHDGIISTNIIKAESWRRTIVIVIDMSEDIGAFISIILVRSPYHLKLFPIEPSHFVLVIDPSKEERIKAHFTE
jgi:hypothetical protein